MDQYDFDAIKARVAELEDKMKFLFRRLNIECIEGDVAQAVDSKVREHLLRDCFLKAF